MLRFSKHDMDLGKLEPNINKHFQITVFNDSNQDVTPKVDASCGCTTPVLEPKTIPANGSAQLLMGFNTQGRQGFQSKNVYVDNTDGTRLTFNFKAYVENGQN